MFLNRLSFDAAPARHLLVLVLLPLLVGLLAAPVSGQEPTTRPGEEHIKRQIALLDEEAADVERQLEDSKKQLARGELELDRRRQALNEMEQRLADFVAQAGTDHSRSATLRKAVEERQKQVEIGETEMERLESWRQELAARQKHIETRRSGLYRQLREAAAAAAQDELAGLRPPSGDRKQLERQIHEAEIRKREAEYTGLRKRLAQIQPLVERGSAPQSEVAELETQIEIAHAELQKVQAQFALRQLDAERGGFDDRNAADSTAAAMQTEFFRGYLDAVERYALLSSNPRNAGVAAVVTAADMLRDQPPQATIDFFAPLLEAGQFPDYTVETAVRLQLAEAYRAAGQTEQALETLRELIVAQRGSGGGMGNP